MEARLPADRASMFGRQAVERGAQLLQVSRKSLVRLLGEFAVKKQAL